MNSRRYGSFITTLFKLFVITEVLSVSDILAVITDPYTFLRRYVKRPNEESTNEDSPTSISPTGKSPNLSFFRIYKKSDCRKSEQKTKSPNFRILEFLNLTKIQVRETATPPKLHNSNLIKLRSWLNYKANWIYWINPKIRKSLKFTRDIRHSSSWNNLKQVDSCLVRPQSH